MGCPVWATGHTTKVAAVAPDCDVCAASQVLKQLYLALFCSGSALPLSELLSQVLEADRPVNTQVWGKRVDKEMKIWCRGWALGKQVSLFLMLFQASSTSHTQAGVLEFSIAIYNAAVLPLLPATCRCASRLPGAGLCCSRRQRAAFPWKSLS